MLPLTPPSAVSPLSSPYSGAVVTWLWVNAVWGALGVASAPPEATEESASTATDDIDDVDGVARVGVKPGGALTTGAAGRGVVEVVC